MFIIEMGDKLGMIGHVFQADSRETDTELPEICGDAEERFFQGDFKDARRRGRDD